MLSESKYIINLNFPNGRGIEYTNKYKFTEELKEAIEDDRILTEEQKKIALSYL